MASENVDISAEACAVACMLVSNPLGEFRSPGWQKRVNDLIRALRAAIDAAAAVDGDAGWRPAATPPKDGEKVDVWVEPPPGCISHGGGRMPDCWLYNGEWRTEDLSADEGWSRVCWPVTHWMRMPAPPSAH
jgi:hypothetical protein